MSNDATREFGPIRSIFWPIHGHELKKIVPMLLMFFFISFNYTVLRDTKDTLIIAAASNSGAETVAFLKVWGVVPAAILFMVIYSKLTNMFDKQKLFYISLTPFLIFFGIFAFVLYPAREALHPEASADALQAFLPAGFKGLVAIYRNWTFSLFYILAELWGSVALSLLFWSFANEITKVGEAKRFYALFGIGANVALIVSGPTVYFFSKIRDKIPAGVDAWGVSLSYLMSFVVVAGILIMLIYAWMNRYILTDTRYYNPEESAGPKKSKPKMGLLEGFKYLFTSKYLGCLALLVIGYGICINLVEISWKHQLHLQYPNPNDYNAFMGGFSTITGIVTTTMMLFVAHNILRHFGWSTAAKITPIVLLITGGAFFAFVIFRDNMTGFIAQLGTSPLMLAVIFGAAQNIMSKSTKYSLFDPTKEMAYIPLDQELKYKGKAAVDVVGARLGKSGGSIVQQSLIMMLGGIQFITPYVAVLMMAFIGIWLLAAKSLGKQFAKLTATREQEQKEKAKKPALATEEASLKAS